MDQPFKGIRVIDMSSHGACPSCTKILSDWGAEVIKIEAPKGDAARSSGKSFGVPCEGEYNPHFDMLNTGKKSLALNAKSSEGAEIIDRLLKSANVFISNFRTPSLARMGLDYDSVKEKYPHLVWAHLSGFGENGLDACNAGFDTVAYYARTGSMLDFSERNTAPINAPFGVGDMSAGASFAGGIAAALYKQKCTGEGSRVVISLYAQGVWAHSVVLQGVEHGNKYPKTRKEAKVPLNNSYRCKDGEWVYISVLQYERYFPTFCKMIEREDLIDNPKFNTIDAASENNEELINIIDEAFRTRNRDEWSEKLREADIAFDHINHLTDVFNDEQATSNNLFYERDYGEGRKSAIFLPPVVIGSPVEDPKYGAPKLSENAAEVLGTIGYSETEINKLFENGVVVKPE